MNRRDAHDDTPDASFALLEEAFDDNDEAFLNLMVLNYVARAREDGCAHEPDEQDR
jgi:hypothetical protein